MKKPELWRNVIKIASLQQAMLRHSETQKCSF